MTKYLLDTNILLRASDPTSPSYSLAVNAVASLIAQGHECAITPQVLIEFWVVATRPVEVNGLGWTPQRTEIEINQLLSQFSLIEETPDIFPNWLQLVTAYQVIGKRTHDIRLVAVMKANDITHILTLNPQDFANVPDVNTLHPNDIDLQPD